MNSAKIIYRTDGSLDFLRTFYDTNDKVANKYLARSLASNIYFKPWSSPQDQTSIDALSSWCMIRSRGGIDSDLMGYDEFNRTMKKKITKK